MKRKRSFYILAFYGKNGTQMTLIYTDRRCSEVILVLGGKKLRDLGTINNLNLRKSCKSALSACYLIINHRLWKKWNADDADLYRSALFRGYFCEEKIGVIWVL